MSAHNFWDNFGHGFIHGMFGNNPFFGCSFGGFSPFSSFGNFNSCFDNSILYCVPNTMSSMYFTQLMPDMSPPAFNFNITQTPQNIFPMMPEIPPFDINKLFPNDNWMQNFNSSPFFTTNPSMSDTFERSNPLNNSSPSTPAPAQSNTSSLGSRTAQSITPSASNSQNTSAYTQANLSKPYNGSAEDLNKNLNKKNGVLKNKGAVFLRAQQKYGVNAAVLAAICIHESAYGTSSLARTKNNVAGISQGRGFKTYSSVDECIMDTAKILKSGYLDKGLVTIEAVGRKYCPVGDPRDKKGVNAGWAGAVNRITKGILA